MDLKGMQGAQNVSMAARMDAREDTSQARKVAQDFEAMFVGEVFKAMRKTVGGEHDFGHQIYSEMFDEQLSHHVAQSGIGLADALMDELGGDKKSSQDLLARVDHLEQERAVGSRDVRAGSPYVKHHAR